MFLFHTVPVLHIDDKAPGNDLQGTRQRSTKPEMLTRRSRASPFGLREKFKRNNLNLGTSSSIGQITVLYLYCSLLNVPGIGTLAPLTYIRPSSHLTVRVCVCSPIMQWFSGSESLRSSSSVDRALRQLTRVPLEISSGTLQTTIEHWLPCFMMFHGLKFILSFDNLAESQNNSLRTFAANCSGKRPTPAIQLCIVCLWLG
jgi:hypothetical protein